jgi:transposase
MVFEEGCSIYEAAQTLNIKYSTAKAIARKYEKTGLIFKHKGSKNQKEVSALVNAQRK